DLRAEPALAARSRRQFQSERRGAADPTLHGPVAAVLSRRHDAHILGLHDASVRQARTENHARGWNAGTNHREKGRVVTNRSFPRLRTALYALRGGFLVRPLLIAIALGLLGAMLSSFEETVPLLSAWVPAILFPSRADPQVAQVVLATIAASIMTVVSIVFAILLMTLTLASMQFSPRILSSFVQDRVTQWTLGIFLGTFAYCVAALPATR